MPTPVIAPVQYQAVSSQPYGRACMNCSRSKCKCITRSGRQRCERCHRLNKSCQPGGSTRSLNAQRNNPIARIAQLEGKLDGLVSMLGAGQVPTTPNPSNHVISPLPCSYSSTPSISLGTSAAFPASAAPPPSATTASEPSSEEAEEHLTNFRTNLLKYFPILHYTGDAQCLRQERPFLFLCIMAASSQSTETKLVLIDRIKYILTQRVFLDNDPGGVDIDLLLGVLIFLAWGHDHLLHGTPASLSRFTQLAMTLVFDLRLNKPLPDDSNMLPVGTMNGDRTAPRSPTRSLEERRAVLGCFVMSSIVSSYFAQIDAMQWTPYMEQCLEVLTQNRECPYDEVLVHQARLQRISDEVESARGGTTTVPLTFYLAALRLRVDDVKAQISPHLQQDRILLASVYYTELSIFGVLLSKQNTTSFERLKCLYACLETVKSALDSIFKIPLSDYPGASFPFFTYLVRCIVILYKLSTLNDPIWDTGLVRSTINVLEVMDRLVSNIQQASAAAGEKSSGGFLDRSTRIFMSFRSWYAAKFSEGAGIDSGNCASQAGGGGTLLSIPLEEMWLEDNFNFGFFEGNDFL